MSLDQIDEHQASVLYELVQCIKNESRVSEVDCPEDTEIVTKLAEHLNLAKITVVEYASVSDEKLDNPSAVSETFDSGKEWSEPVIHRELLQDNSVVIIKAFPQKDIVLSDFEREILEIFCTNLYIVKSRIRLTTKLVRAVFYDHQLGIYSFAYGEKMISQVLQTSESSKYAVAFFNLFRFSNVNELLGRHRADEAMRAYAREFQKLFTEPEIIWRVGGDNFGALFRKEHLDSFLELIQGKSIRYGRGTGEKLLISATAGIYLITENTDNRSQVIDSAMAAMASAKYDRHVRYVVFDEGLGKELEHTRRIESGFDKTVRNHEYYARYQPKVSLDGNRLIGAEALCRWKHGDKEIQPFEFIPMLEKSIRICQLDFYMLDHVCSDIAGWIKEGIEPVKVSVNFSRKHLNDEHFVERIISVLDKHSVPHELISVEFTETSSEEDYQKLKKVIFELKDNNIEAVVDDFGIGYSSLSLIAQVPFKELKIDKFFVDKITDEKSNNTIMIRNIINMAHDMNMMCIAEGVESIEQIEVLKRYGCLNVQGYYFDKPLEKEEFRTRLLSPVYDTKK